MKKNLHQLFITVLVSAVFIGVNQTRLNAQAGTLDLSFGDNGKAFTTHGNFRAIALQQDNKIILTGKSYKNGKAYIATYRYKSNGVIDSGYGTNGVTKTSFEGYTYAANGEDIAVQQDGKIVVVGNIERSTIDSLISKSVVLRFLRNGKPDSSFGINGSIIMPEKTLALNKVLIQPDDKIICAGAGAYGNKYSDFLIYRFNSDGTTDSTFGKNGMSSIDFNKNVDFLSDCILKSNGQIISFGDGYTDHKLELAESGINGHLVKQFGTDGKVVVKGDFPSGLAMQRSGRLIVNFVDTSDKTLFLAFTNKGVIDSSFGVNGMYELPQQRLYTVSTCIQDDNKIIGVGNYLGKLFAYRLLPDGNFDSAFATEGLYVADSLYGATDVILQKSNKILICGNANINQGLLTRLNNDPILFAYFSSKKIFSKRKMIN